MKIILAGALALSMMAGAASAQTYDQQDHQRGYQQDQRGGYQQDQRGGDQRGWRGDYRRWRGDYRRHPAHRVCYWRYHQRVCRWER